MTKSTTTQARLSSAAIRPLHTLDPAALDWLDTAIGESAHYNAESYLMRHLLLRYLVERHGFSAYAMESGFVEGRLTDEWIRGEAGRVDGIGTVMANSGRDQYGFFPRLSGPGRRGPARAFSPPLRPPRAHSWDSGR